MRRRKALLLLALLFSVVLLVVARAPTLSPDVRYVPTPQKVVEAMLTMADVKAGDVVYDLGSGDGRIPITAVEKFGARSAVGIEIDPKLIKEANANLAKSKAGDRVRFVNDDLFTTNFSEATVVTLYLGDDLNVRLRPKLLSEMKPGTRIVSHQFRMGDWQPEKIQKLEGRTIYFWTIPAKK